MSDNFKTAVQIEQEVAAQIELFMSVTNGQVTKVGVNSVAEGILAANAKTAQMINTDVLNLRADNSPDLAFGTQLDDYATRNGYGLRYTATKSSTYIFLVATAGTVYLANTHYFLSKNGEQFELTDDVTISSIGFAYAKIQSQNTGSQTNVNANNINICQPTPTGHNFCTNDFNAIGGSDSENDNDFRVRIKNYLNSISINTLAQYTQIFQKVNNRVLSVYKGGVDQLTGKLTFYVSSINGIDFTSDEFDAIETYSLNWISQTDADKGLLLKNMTYAGTSGYIDIYAQVDLQSGGDVNTIRVLMQKNIQRKYDFRYIRNGDVISRNDLMLIIQSTQGVKRVLTNSFTPLADITISNNQLVRFRSFVLADLNGNVISNNNNTINSVYSNFFANYTNTEFQNLLNSLS